MSASKELVKLLKESDKKGTSPYDTEAKVKRIDGSTAWVHIPGGVDETPVRLTIGAKVGDTVQVRVSGGRAWLVGNGTAPPTDDSTAIRINNETNTRVRNVQKTAENAVKIAGNTNQYFWHTESGNDTGAHITEVPREQFLNDPTNGGGNLLARSNGIAVRDGLDELATFGADGVQIGVEGEAVLEMDSRSLKLVNKEGEAYFQVSNLKDEHEDYKRTEQHIGWNMQLSINGVLYYAVGLNEYAGSVESVSVNGTPKSSPTDYILYNDPVYGFSLVCFVANIGTTAVVDVVYYTDSGALKAYTIGIREQDSDVGLFSIAEGRYVEASGYYSHAQNIGTIANTFGQTAIGIYNDTPNSNAAFIIGNGNNDVSRSTAFVVEWDGNIQMALSTTAASGTDHDLYTAITALGWQSEVIV